MFHVFYNMMDLEISKNNPIVLRDHRSLALEKAYESLQKLLDNYITENNIDPVVSAEIKRLRHEVYTESKVSYLIDNKLNTFSDYLESSMCFALKTSYSPKKVFTDLFYVKHSKQLLTHEQY